MTIFLQNVWIFCMLEFFFFLFFCSLQKDRSFNRMSVYLFYVSNAEQWIFCLFFLIFFIDFKLIQTKIKNVFLLTCSLHCAHILHILVSIILAFSWNLHLFLVYWFFQLLKMNDFSFFLGFRHFFGVQLISFNIRQYWEFDSKPFPNCPLLTYYCYFLPTLVLV